MRELKYHFRARCRCRRYCYTSNPEVSNTPLIDVLGGIREHMKTCSSPGFIDVYSAAHKYLGRYFVSRYDGKEPPAISRLCESVFWVELFESTGG